MSYYVACLVSDDDDDAVDEVVTSETADQLTGSWLCCLACISEFLFAQFQFR